jgi:hypothetical protein
MTGTAGSLPEDIRDLILKRIDSVGQLEALLFLWRDAAVSSDAATVAKQLYIGEKQAVEILEHLCAQGFAMRSDDTFRFQCASTELSSQVDRLAQIYKTHLIPVTHLIHSKAAGRIREFADAFKLRKDR